jgi:hypothetical protein
MSEELKASMLKRARLAQLSKTFYDPEGIIVHQRQLDRDKLRSSAEARIGTPKNDDDEKSQGAKVQEKYYPLAPEQWKKPFLDLRQLSLIKNPRVLQTLFYLLSYTREQICERGTNSLDFKLAKELINEQLFQKMASYNPIGARDGEYKDYQKISFLKKNISECTDEAVEEFALVMSKILKWLQLVLDTRCEDVVRRRDAVEVARQEREGAIKLDNARKEKYDKEMQEKKTVFEEAVEAEVQKQFEAAVAKATEEEQEPPAEPDRSNVPQFNEAEFKSEFDLANQEVVIPDEVQDEVDKDYDLPYNAPAPTAE